MNPHSITRLGPSTITSYSRPTDTTSVDVRPDAVIQVYTECSGWPVIKGDHKKPNPHKYSNVLLSGTGTGYYDYDDGSWTRFDTSGPGYDSVPSCVFMQPYAYAKALEELNDKVRGGLDLSVDAFQARQTMGMLNAVNRVEDLARQVARRSRGKTKLIGSLWLELQYGWKPLLSDIYDTYDEQFRYILNNLSTYVGKGSIRESRLGSLTPIYAPFPVNARVNQELKFTTKISVTVAEDKTFNLARYASLNPISIGWELVPYSFVVDWFYDVGSFVRGVETALLYGRSFQSGFISEYWESRATPGGFYSERPAGNDYVRRADITGFAKRNSFERRLLYGYPFPSTPKLNYKLSSGRLLNAAGLLSQFLKGRY